MNKRYTADFETTTDVNDCRIWAWGVCSIDDDLKFECGNNMDSFFDFLKSHSGTYLFHNLKFDGSFIMWYLYENGYEQVNDKKELKDKSFCTLISDTGQWYEIHIMFKKGNNRHHDQVKIWDSMKIFNMSVDKVSESFKLPISKLDLDYKSFRAVNHKLTKEEKEYLKNDVEIMARALKIFYGDGHKRMTIGSNAMAHYKTTIKNWKHLYPEIEETIDEYIRESYRGGFTYLSPKYKGKDVERGIVIDKNSMYPSMMRYNLLPYGDPIYFNGKYEEDEEYPLYVQRVACTFKLKKGKIPMIQCKHTFSFLPNEYVEDSNYEVMYLTLTSVDLKLFLENYEMTTPIEYIDGFKFKATRGLFDKYIDYWTRVKIKSKEEKNGGMYTISKLFLNSLYG